ncbi:hypothetical protein WJX74_003678 [Apatococcus lobatus]|uniref:UDP-N-acetylglucosamine diphosphorylase n=1 Tax=Apatococcus lobatus TaxID=904363 RepID=A0AAW1RH57_9CHLO
MATVFQALLEQTGQHALLQHYEGLPEHQQIELENSLKEVNLKQLRSSFDQCFSQGQAHGDLQPSHAITRLQDVTEEQMQDWQQVGLQLVSQGKVGVVLLAGGQGTRLGSSQPKGCYNIGLPSGKSLFQLQAERILRLQQLAAAASGQPDGIRKPVRWYIMTSRSTHEATTSFFKDHGHFGLQASQLFFFQQGELPALTEDGQIILASQTLPAMSPNGNGGIYEALHKSGALADMQAQGVEAVDCYSVDNALVRPGSPTFIGHCWQRNTDCGARVVAKAYPEEKVGVFAQRGSRIEVVEYSELDPGEAASTDPGTGELRYNWSNVCMHYFSRHFLQRAADFLASGRGSYHAARKSIPSKDGPVQGVKLEAFIFDTFAIAHQPSLMEVLRHEEFAPVKNARGAAKDSPDTARAAVLALHSRWMQRSGASQDDKEAEISPLAWILELSNAQGQQCAGPLLGTVGEENLGDNSRQGLESVLTDALMLPMGQKQAWPSLMQSALQQWIE